VALVRIPGNSINRKYNCAKMKYFRSLNGILGKVGTSTAIDVTLSLVSSFFIPILLFGLETGCLSKAQINKLNFPYSSVFTKLFSTFDKAIIMKCQYYTGYLPLRYILDLKFLNFLRSTTYSNSPANQLYYWFGNVERQSVALQYNININDNKAACKKKMWQKFKIECEVI